MIDQRFIKCSNCKTDLKANRVLTKLFWKIVIYIVFILSITAFVMFGLNKESLGIYILASLSVPGYFLERKAWKTGGYEEKEKSEPEHGPD
jgi:hypothetical protein